APSVLRIMERDRDIPFDELVTSSEQPIHTAYLKHVGQSDEKPSGHKPGEPLPVHPTSRVVLDRKTGHVTVFVEELDEDGNLVGEAIEEPSDFGRIAAFAAKQV